MFRAEQVEVLVTTQVISNTYSQLNMYPVIMKYWFDQFLILYVIVFRVVHVDIDIDIAH